MTDVKSMTDQQLQTLLQQCRAVLGSLVESLEERPDMQAAIRQLMTPDDMLEAFSQIGVKDPDLARLTLQASVAALMNTQTVMAIEAEFRRRAHGN